MRLSCIFISFTLLLVCRGQNNISGRSMVFKVRAPLTKCSVFCEDSVFLLERENSFRVKVKDKNKSIKVTLEGGNIISHEGEAYTCRFGSSGIAVITVYQESSKGLRLLFTKKMLVTEPPLFFCGIQLDSASKVLKMKGCQLYAYSKYYGIKMPVVSFDMYFAEDTTKHSVKPIRLKSDTCIISPEMKDKLLHFQCKHSDIYFHNIMCIAPDGHKKLLSPVQLKVKVDSTNTKELNLIYAVQKKIF